ncbi:MAG TPA: hypothetical protein VJL10_06950 [Anaerolineales bacterium]|nr:hypothetical protein [Anaerolineales bacterium]
MKFERSPFAMIIAIIVLLVFLGMPSSQPANAKSNDPTNRTPKHTEIAVLRNLKTNERIKLPIKKYNGKVPNSTIYEVFVPSSILSYESHQHPDDTGGVTLTITQSYSERSYPEYSVSLTSSSAKWMKSDNTISITNASVTSAVAGYISGGGFLIDDETRSIGVPSLNTWYYQYPSWTGTYIIINDMGYQATRADSLLVRGGASWDFGFCVAQGGGQVISCE